jgi:hypothetical protein
VKTGKNRVVGSMASLEKWQKGRRIFDAVKGKTDLGEGSQAGFSRIEELERSTIRWLGRCNLTTLAPSKRIIWCIA